jgi:hypothetical protein
VESAIVVADTSVLVNFLRIDRMDLIGHHPQRFLATDHVDAESLIIIGTASTLSEGFGF